MSCKAEDHSEDISEDSLGEASICRLSRRDDCFPRTTDKSPWTVNTIRHPYFRYSTSAEEEISKTDCDSVRHDSDKLCFYTNLLESIFENNKQAITRNKAHQRGNEPGYTMDHKDFVSALVSVLALFVCVCVSAPTGGQLCATCNSLDKNFCGDRGTCKYNFVEGHCEFICICSNGGSGVGCQQQDSGLPNAPVIRERLLVKVNPIQSLNLGLFGEHLFDLNFSHNAEPPEPSTTTSTTTTKRPTTTTTTTTTKRPTTQTIPITTTTTATTSASTSPTTTAAQSTTGLSRTTPKPTTTTTEALTPTTPSDSASAEQLNSSEMVTTADSSGSSLGDDAVASGLQNSSTAVVDSVKPPTHPSSGGSLETVGPGAGSDEMLPGSVPASSNAGTSGVSYGGGGNSGSLSANNTLGNTVGSASGSSTGGSSSSGAGKDTSVSDSSSLDSASSPVNGGLHNGSVPVAQPSAVDNTGAVAGTGGANSLPSAGPASASTGTDASSAASGAGSLASGAGTANQKPDLHTASSSAPGRLPSSGAVAAHIPSMSEAQALLSSDLTNQRTLGSSSQDTTGVPTPAAEQPASSSMLEKLRQMYMAAQPNLTAASANESVNGTSSSSGSSPPAGSDNGRVASLSSASQNLPASLSSSKDSSASQPSSQVSSKTTQTTTLSPSHP
ncbi:hypothetical protein ACOMHN_043914 [Nucella lapillus]